LTFKDIPVDLLYKGYLVSIHASFTDEDSAASISLFQCNQKRENENSRLKYDLFLE
jgi:hypothetical protein